MSMMAKLNAEAAKLREAQAVIDALAEADKEAEALKASQDKDKKKLTKWKSAQPDGSDVHRSCIAKLDRRPQSVGSFRRSLDVCAIGAMGERLLDVTPVLPDQMRKPTAEDIKNAERAATVRRQQHAFYNTITDKILREAMEEKGTDARAVDGLAAAGKLDEGQTGGAFHKEETSAFALRTKKKWERANFKLKMGIAAMGTFKASAAEKVLVTKLPRAVAEAKWRLVCVPWAGASTQVFDKWGTYLPNVEVVACQLPGRLGRHDESEEYTVADAARQLLDAMRDAGMLAPAARPYMLYGHGLGALVAHQACVQARQRRVRRPRHLFVSGCKAPAQFLGQQAVTRDCRTEPVDKHHGGHVDKDAVPPVHARTDEELLALTRLLHMDVLPDLYSEAPEMFAPWAKLLRADFRALETHVYAPDWALTVPISCVAGKFDMCVGGNPSVGRLGKDAMKALEEWQGETTREDRFEVKTVEGNHYSMLEMPLLVKTLAFMKHEISTTMAEFDENGGESDADDDGGEVGDVTALADAARKSMMKSDEENMWGW